MLPHPAKNHVLIVGDADLRKESVELPFTTMGSSPTSLHKFLKDEKMVDLYVHLEKIELVAVVVVTLETTGSVTAIVVTPGSMKLDDFLGGEDMLRNPL